MNRFAVSALAAPILCASLAAGCGGEPPGDALRLLHPPAAAAAPAVAEGAAAVPAVRLVAVEGPELPAGGERLHEAPGVAPVPAPGRLAEVVLADDEISDQRLALVARAATRYRYRVDLADGPRRPRLRLAVAAFRPDPPAAAGDEPAAAEGAAAAPARLAFRVTATPADRPEAERVELHRGVETAGGGPLWRPLDLDLEPFAGGAVELELAVDAAPSAGGAAAGRESGGPALGAWALPEVVAGGAREEGWDVIFVSLDTLRADHLGAYGYHRPTSPHLDAFAARGVRFAAAVAQSPWTRPSHMSMLNGLYPASHGPLASPLLAEVLRRAGWRTGAITGSGQVDASFGFDAGMDRYAVGDWIADPELVLDWLEEGEGRRQFLFLHTYKIHDPYEEHDFTAGLPRGRIGESFADADYRRLGKRLTPEEKTYVEALYDGGIADADRALGELFAALEERGVLDRAIVVVTSDHGEQFWEHGSWRHGQNLYDHQLMVPLIVHLPPDLERELAGGRLERRVVERQVELLDLYPTLLELLGVPLEHRVQGASLVPLLAGGEYRGEDAFAENTNVRTFEKKGFRTERFKFVKSIPRQAARRQGHEEPYYELYDLRRDPGEQENVADRHPKLVEALEARLQLLRQGGGGPLAEELPEGLDPELEERLRALGYLGE